MSSIKKNIFANYASQIYMTLIAMIMTPMYVRYLGIESYGLVGFFAMLQAWFQLFDIGLSPTMARQTAQFRGGALSGFDLRCLLRSLEYFFICIALLGSLSLIVSSGYISLYWLKIKSIPLDEIKFCIKVMAVIIALRWVSSLYRGVVNGFEQFIWLSRFNIVFATVKFPCVVLVFIFISNTIKAFFIYQLIVVTIELFTLVLFVYKLLPCIKSDEYVKFSWSLLRSIFKFSLSIAFTTMIWILITQSDKLILSKALTLSDYGYFSLAVLMAAGINAMATPISTALVPRLAKLSSENQVVQLIGLYRKTTQMLIVVVAPITITIALFSEQVILSWTGDAILAKNVAPILLLYALGNGLLAIAALPSHLQFAKGNLRLHVIGNILFTIVFIPLLIWATQQFGVIGSSCSWLGLNTAYFLLWVPVVHRRFLMGLHVTWLINDIVIIVMPVVFCGIFIKNFASWPIERVALVTQIMCVGFLLFIVAISQSSLARTFFINKLLMSSKMRKSN